MPSQEQQVLSPSRSTDSEDDRIQLSRLKHRSKHQLAVIVKLRNTVSNLSKVVSDQESQIEQLQRLQCPDEILTPESGIFRNQLYKVPYDDDAIDYMNLSPELMKGMRLGVKFQKLSNCQAIALPMILSSNDFIAQGYIASDIIPCFAVGMLSSINTNLNRTQVLCICPTPERAIENLDLLRKIGKYTGITSESAIPKESLEGKPKFPGLIFAQAVIGTPGTIKRLMSQKKLSVTNLKVLVFDEADQMLAKDGFQDDSLKIVKDIERAKVECKVLLFSTTFSESVKIFVAKTLQGDHYSLFVKKEEFSLDSVKQYKVTCSDEIAKSLVVKAGILEFPEKTGRASILLYSKHAETMLNNSLIGVGYKVATTDVLNAAEVQRKFKKGFTRVRVSTDLRLRWIDRHQVRLVVDYDPSEPNYKEDLHRIGRAGHRGCQGATSNSVEDSEVAVEGAGLM